MTKNDPKRATLSPSHADLDEFLMNEDECLMDEHEVARVLHVKVTTLRRWRWAGRPPPFVKIGSAVRYERPVIRVDPIAVGCLV